MVLVVLYHVDQAGFDLKTVVLHSWFPNAHPIPMDMRLIIGANNSRLAL